MKKCFLLLLFLILAVPTVFAQNDSLQLRKNEIGIDFLPLIRENLTGSILYRYHQQNAAWRLRLAGSFHQQYEFQNTNEFRREAKITFRAGREWHQDFNQFRVYYGLDLGVSYFSSHHSVQQPEWFELHDRTLEGGILPLLGFGYHINKRLMVSAETNARIAGGKNWNWSRSRYGNRISYISFEALSEYALFMAFRF